MRAEHLIKILSEYRPSMKLVMMVDDQPRFDMPVAQMISNLMSIDPPSDYVTFFGETFFILRERMKGFGPDPRPCLPTTGPLSNEWLELDVRPE